MADEDPLTEAETAAFAAACKDLGINPAKLPPGILPRDIIDSAKIVPTDERRRGIGRPRKSDPVIQWTEVHDLLVYGEAYTDEAGVQRHRYPGINELCRRYDVSKSSMQHYMRKHDIERRRAEVKAEEDAIVHQHIIHGRAADRASLAEKALTIAHVVADRYLEGLTAPRSAPNHIRVDSAADLRSLIELATKLNSAAGADDDKVTVTLSIEGLRDRHERVRTRRVIAGASIGVVADDGDDDAMVLDVEAVPASAPRPTPPPQLGAVDSGEGDDDPWKE